MATITAIATGMITVTRMITRVAFTIRPMQRSSTGAGCRTCAAS
jgi:hypothetical protein